MTETFEHPDDHTGDDHTPAHDEPGFGDDHPVAPDDPLVHDEPTALDEPALPDPEVTPEAVPTAEVWHDDPGADDELRSWLDAGEPTLDPPPGFEQQLAAELTAEAAGEGQSVDDLVRDVLDRLKRT